MRRATIAALTRIKARVLCSGGKFGGCSDVAAQDPHGVQELDPVRVDIGLGRRSTDQRADRVMGEQVPVDLLVDGIGLVRAQDPARAAEISFELAVPGLVFPSFVVGLR